jgi:two-component system cell cycle sensor histidine kinase/response regulator CckA
MLDGIPSADPAPLQRQQANQALRDERFRLLVQAVKGYAIFMLDPDGRIICWNTGAELIFGYHEQEVVGRHYALFFTPEDVQAGAPGGELDSARTGGSFEGECRRVRKDGSQFLAHAVLAAVRHAETGQLLGFSQVTHDVTERKHLEEQLRQAHKMEAVGSLAAGVAHDFNNLLTVILGYSDILLATLHEHDQARASVEQIGKAGARAAALTRQLLAFSRRQVLRPQVLDVNARLADIETFLRRLIREDIEVVIEPAPGLWHVEADPVQLEQVILNLAVNARDAMPRGGRLTVQTANVELGRTSRPAPPEVQAGPYVMLALSDTGVGMDPATLARIFDPFFTTKRPGQGTGLGLSTVYGIVKQSGGHVEVESRPGAGTAFRVYLPATDGAAQLDRARAPVSGVAGGKETLLLVEDEAGIRGLGQVVLRDAGYNVLVASDGEEALEISMQHKEVIHLLVTDVIMPGMSGVQVANRLTALRPGLKVLYMSGYAEDAVARQGMLGPGTPFLPKPFAPKDLAIKVRELLDG